MAGTHFSNQQLQVLHDLEIDVWRVRADVDAVVTADRGEADVRAGNSAEDLRPPTPATDWDGLNAAIRSCTQCALHSTRTQAVCGVGDTAANWLVVGEAPGADEDVQGEPFVGRAGQLLNEMLLAIGLAREQVYIANVLKCRPPNNRNPSAAEIEKCLPHLEQQIALLQPKIILIVGAIAARTLLEQEPNVPVGRLRGDVHYIGREQVPAVVTYHPAYLLRKPIEKRKSWADLQLAVEVARAQA